MLEIISQPWHWAVSGAMIAFVMLLLLWLGGEFGVSSNLRTICAIGGAGKKHDFFRFDWKEQIWNLVFILGAVVGGWIAVTLIQSPEPVQVAESTREYLSSIGISTPLRHADGSSFVPQEIFAGNNLLNRRTTLPLLIIGGFLVGFGARWAGGCTSGHAISGLSDLQLPSLIAVIGFFIGGLIMVWGIFPLLITM